MDKAAIAKILGGPILVHLGTPVSAEIEVESSTVNQERNRIDLTNFFRKILASGINWNQRRIALIAIGGFLLVTAALTGASLATFIGREKKGEASEIQTVQIPIASKSTAAPDTAASGVKSVDAPYVDSQAQAGDGPALPKPIETNGDEPLGIPRLTNDRLLEQVTSIQQESLAKVAAPKGKELPESKDVANKKASESLLVDEEFIEPKEKGPLPKVDAAKNTSAAKPPPLPKAKVEVGLVAISQDGRFALFTNPKTRMPEKVLTGEKLPNGETLKLIDKSAGRVETDTKEYRLE